MERQDGIPPPSRISEEDSPLAKVLRAVDLLNFAASQLGGNGDDNDDDKGFSQSLLLSGSRLGSMSSQSVGLWRSDSGAGVDATLLPRWAELLETEANRIHESYGKMFHKMNRSLSRETLQSSEPGSVRHDVTESRANHVWTIHPQSAQRLMWDAISVIVIAWDVFVIPLHTFNLRTIEVVLVKADWCVTFFWTLDAIMSIRTGFFSKRYVEMEAKRVALNYFKTWMSLDVAIVTAEWVTCLTQNAGGASAARFQRLRILTRYLRGVRSGKLKFRLLKLRERLHSFHSQLCFSLTRTCICLLYICHFLACGWHAIGRRAPDGWVHREHVMGDRFYVLLYSYVTASRWTLAQINGRTDLEDDRNMQERIYTVVCAIFAVVFKSLFISALTTRMVELMRIMSGAQKGMRLLKTFVGRHKLSHSTAYFAREYVKKHQYLQSQAATESVLLDYLPDHLQWDLVYEVRAPTLICHPLMKDLNINYTATFRQMLATATSNEYTRVLQILFEPAMPCERVLFHKEGEVRYTRAPQYKSALRDWAKEDTPSALMASLKSLTSKKLLKRPCVEDAFEYGDEVPRLTCLSEAALWIKWKHRGALVSVTESHLLALDIKMFLKILVEYPDAEARAAIYAWSFGIKIQECELLDLMEQDFGEILPEEELSPDSALRISRTSTDIATCVEEQESAEANMGIDRRTREQQSDGSTDIRSI